jgi:hypothetical protein
MVVSMQLYLSSLQLLDFWKGTTLSMLILYDVEHFPSTTTMEGNHIKTWVLVQLAKTHNHPLTKTVISVLKSVELLQIWCCCYMYWYVYVREPRNNRIYFLLNSLLGFILVLLELISRVAQSV